MGFTPPDVARQREAEAVALRREGRSQREIARELGITQPGVVKIFQRIDARLLADLEKTVKVMKVQQAHVLQYILEESLHAWRQSKEPSQTSSKKTRKQPTRQSATGALIDGEALQALEELFQKAETRYGDPRFLREGREALADIRKLFGLDIAPAPQSPHLNPLDKLSPEELARMAARLEKQIDDARTARGSK